jgi:hypothetical protein
MVIQFVHVCLYLIGQKPLLGTELTGCICIISQSCVSSCVRVMPIAVCVPLLEQGSTNKYAND